jgi:hypothetical protein
VGGVSGMKRVGRALVVSTFCLLSIATSASAECAWVLWTTRYKISGGEAVAEITVPSEAYTNKGDCDRTLQQRENREKERHKNDPTRERYFVCLPDTVDPRGPKGK